MDPGVRRDDNRDGRKYGALYTGVTGNLPARTTIHRKALVPGFTSRYKIHQLVYFEPHGV
jgi:putative endonuclease